MNIDTFDMDSARHSNLHKRSPIDSPPQITTTTPTTTTTSSTSISLRTIMTMTYAYIHHVVFSITAIISFLAYFHTVSPSVAGGDSGELLAEGCALGTAHPPGYPLYVIIVYVTTNMGRFLRQTLLSRYEHEHEHEHEHEYSEAFFVNVTSCIFGAIASGLIASSVLFLLQDNTERRNRMENLRRISKFKPKSKSKSKLKLKSQSQRFERRTCTSMSAHTEKKEQRKMSSFSCSSLTNIQAVVCINTYVSTCVSWLFDSFQSLSTIRRPTLSMMELLKCTRTGSTSSAVSHDTKLSDKCMETCRTSTCSITKKSPRIDVNVPKPPTSVRTSSRRAGGSTRTCTPSKPCLRNRNDRGQFVKITPQDNDDKKNMVSTSSSSSRWYSHNSNDNDNNDDDDDTHITTIMNACIAISVGMLNTQSPLTWQYSITAEVFALHNLCIAFILHSTVRFAMNPCVTTLQLGAFACGLALTNQHTSILLSLPLICWVCYGMRLFDSRNWIIRPMMMIGSVSIRSPGGNGRRDDDYDDDDDDDDGKRSKSFHVLWQVSLYFSSSFVILYATLPLFATLYPHAGSWGDVTNVIGFLRHFLRKDYGTLQLFSGNDHGAENWVTRTYLWAKDYTFVQIPSPIYICFFIVGCLESISKEMIRWSSMKQFYSRRKSGVERHWISKKGDDKNKNGIQVFPPIRMEGSGIEIIILFSLAFYLVVFHSLSNLPLNNELYFGIHQRFWMQPNQICHIFIGLGVSKVMNYLPKRSSKLSCFISVLLLIGIIGGPLREGLVTNDQSDNYYMRSYASSILATLPSNSILFINYDQQWTSVRYLQECEGSYGDITSINLSMMSYKWWNVKHGLYKDIHFPGTHYTDRGEGGFTFGEVLDVNYDKFKGKIFIGGNLPYMDPGYLQRYEEIPHGIVRKIRRIRDGDSDSMEKYQNERSIVWDVVMKEYSPGLPSPLKYGEDTWESTVVREFYDHVVSSATHLLDLTVSHLQSGGQDPKALQYLVSSLVWIELARLNDDASEASSPLLKNLGLGYMHMVRSANKDGKLPGIDDLGIRMNAIMPNKIEEVWWNGNHSGEWKMWASTQWVECWSRFLEMDASKSDPSYDAVKNIYDTVMSNVSVPRSE